MRLGKRERARVRQERILAASLENERRARAARVSDDPYVPSFVGPMVDRVRRLQGKPQVRWQYRTKYFSGTSGRQADYSGSNFELNRPLDHK